VSLSCLLDYVICVVVRTRYSIDFQGEKFLDIDACLITADMADIC
jgi:hypothetical protein